MSWDEQLGQGCHLGRVPTRAGGVILSHVKQHTDSLLHGQLTGGAARQQPLNQLCPLLLPVQI